jgi:regulator of protease activity HflC (stomatin/prohibitin superfamily)
VVEAEAAANAQIAQACGEAQAIVMRAQAQADANAQISKSLTPEILRWRAVSTWDGKLPAFVGTNAPLPFISMDSKSP